MQYDANGGVLCAKFVQAERHRALRYVAVFKMKLSQML